MRKISDKSNLSPPLLWRGQGGGLKVHYSIRDIIDDAVTLLNRNWLKHIGFWILFYAATFALQTLLLTRGDEGADFKEYIAGQATAPQTYIFLAVDSLMAAVLMSGYLRMCFADIDGENSGLRSFAQPVSVYLNLILGYLAVLTLCLIGTALCVIPGIILMVRLPFVQMYIVDKRLNCLDAMKASWRATAGNGWHLFTSILALLFVLLAGYLLCCVGILYTMPLYYIAFCMLYRSVSPEA